MAFSRNRLRQIRYLDPHVQKARYDPALRHKCLRSFSFSQEKSHYAMVSLLL
jgi:hypothetical protein